MKIKDMPEQNRPRERFKKYGPETLSDAELFAIILRTGTSGENVVDMSNRLIAEYGLDKLFECSLKELQSIKGIGPDKSMQILSMAELGKRYQLSKKPLKKIKTPNEVYDLLYEKLKNEKQENIIILMLNAHNNIIGEELISKGILNASIIHPREIFKPAIKNSASKIIMVHNHPSGDPNPSKNDKEITMKLHNASKILDIELLDHIILGEKKLFSIKENRLIII